MPAFGAVADVDLERFGKGSGEFDEAALAASFHGDSAIFELVHAFLWQCP